MQPSKAKSSSPSPLCGGLFLLHFLCSPYRHLLGVWEQILLLSPPDPTRRRWEASLPVLAYSGEKAWGQGQRQADTNSVTASLVSHSAEAAGRSASPPDGLVSHHRSQRLLWSQPSSGRCSGSYGFTGLSSLSRVTTLLWKRSPRGDPKQDRKSSAFPGTPPPPQLSNPFTEGSNGLDKPSEVPGCYSVLFVRLMNLLSHRINTISCAKEVIFYTAVP